MLNIISKNLYLRKLVSQDATEVYSEWLNDENISMYMETRHTEHSIKSCVQFIEDCNNSMTQFLFGVFKRSNDRHIGNIKVGFIDRYSCGQVSLFIGDKNCWGYGYATESINMISKFSFDELNLNRLEAGIYRVNIGSFKAFIKAGYTLECIQRNKFLLDNKYVDGYSLALLRDEYKDMSKIYEFIKINK